MSHDVYAPPQADLVASRPDDLLDVPPYAGIGDLLGLGLRWSLDAAGALIPLALAFYALAFVTQSAASLLVAGVINRASSPLVRPGSSDFAPGGYSELFGVYATAAPVLVLSLLVQVLFTALGEQARLHALIERRRGAPGGFGQSMRFALSRLWPAFWAELRRTLILIVGVVACLIPGVIVWPRLAFISECVALEPGRGPLGQSFTLTSDRAGRVFLLLLSVTGVTVLVNLPFQLPNLVETAAPGVLPVAMHAGSPAAMVVGVVSGIVMSLLAIWGSAANLALYLSIRAEPEVLETADPVRVPWVEPAP